MSSFDSNFTTQELAILHMTHDFKRDKVSSCTWFDAFGEIFNMSTNETGKAAKRLASLGLIKIRGETIFITHVTNLLFKSGLFGDNSFKRVERFMKRRVC
jgi:hypothetical protein